MMRMSADPLDEGRPEPTFITVRIVRTEEQSSILMQRFTAYVIEVNDFGQISEVAHRYGDFETLHRALLTDCPGISLPMLPPKGMDGTDIAVVASRKVELEKLLRALLVSPEALLDKQLHLWKFLNLPNPAVIASRFILLPRTRPAVLKTLAKLTDPKYRDDMYRLGHPVLLDLLLEGVREIRDEPVGPHWSQQEGGRSALCQLLAGALSVSEASRRKLIQGGVIGSLLGIVERQEDALDDARIALNVIVTREAERFGTLLTDYVRSGGISQLTVLAARPKSQEFVAKLLWLSWDAPVRKCFTAPGSVGPKLLQALTRSSTASCSLLGAVLLSGLVAGGDFADPSHRSEALRLAQDVLQKAEALADLQFGKALCGSAAAVPRLADMLEDPDLAPSILGLLCAAKPPAAKLTGLTGNLAALVSQDGGSRARAAELLLHIQGDAGTAQTPAPQVSAAHELLERCEGLAAHEESMEQALRTQLLEGVAKGRQALEEKALSVRDAGNLAKHRLQALPILDFRALEQALASHRASREALQRAVQQAEALHHQMQSQLNELEVARPSTVDPASLKERILAAEQLYSEVKTQKDRLATADQEARAKKAAAEVSAANLRKATEATKRLFDEIGNLRHQSREKQTQASQLRHKANTPGMAQMKEQIAESLERNIAQAKELQVIGQRVQQGDPDYLKDWESRDQKISELSAKLAALKKQHQQLLQQQKEFDFDPAALGDQAARLELEAGELGQRAELLESQRLEAEQDQAVWTGTSAREAQEARAAEETRASLSSRVAALEKDVRSQMATLQPLLQAHHAGWQRLLTQQRKLDADLRLLQERLDHSKREAEAEAQARGRLAHAMEELTQNLQTFRSFLDQTAGEPLPLAAAPAPQLVSPPATSHGYPPTLQSSKPAAAVNEDIFADLDAGPVQPAAASAAANHVALDDDFDSFLREAAELSFPAVGPAPPSGDAFADEL